jgi:hypothetical protein
MGRHRLLLGLIALALLALVGLALLVDSEEARGEPAAGYNGHIQSGTCANPTDDVEVDLESELAYDVTPYLTEDADEPLAYYGAPLADGFGLAAVYTDQAFSLVITDPESGDPVACGNILRADEDRFREAGIALVQLLPVEDAEVHGVASIERTALQRELDIPPTQVRILLSEGAPPSASAEPAEGYDGYIQGGSCRSPDDEIQVDLESEQDHDVNPYLADPPTGDPVTLAYYGAPRAPGFGLGAAYTDQEFSLVVTGDDGDPVACGDILQADSDDFREGGAAVVLLSPVEESGVQGYAVIERTAMQRELDITPTRVRILLFAPPAT